MRNRSANVLPHVTCKTPHLKLRNKDPTKTRALNRVATSDQQTTKDSLARLLLARFLIRLFRSLHGGDGGQALEKVVRQGRSLELFLSSSMSVLPHIVPRTKKTVRWGSTQRDGHVCQDHVAMGLVGDARECRDQEPVGGQRMLSDYNVVRKRRKRRKRERDVAV